MARKEFSFRGKSLEDVRKLSLEEFSKLCTARPRRTIVRQKAQYEHIMKKIAKYNEGLKGTKPPRAIRTHWRDLIVVPAMVGVKLAIHAGKEFNEVEVKPEMLGHVLGEFALTRKKLSHGKAGIGATRSSTAIAARK